VSLGSLLTKLEPREGPADVVKILCFEAVGRKPRQHPLTKLEPRRPRREEPSPRVSRQKISISRADFRPHWLVMTSGSVFILFSN
jgi:hypothetical protein